MRRAMELFPGSVLALAREAGVSGRLLRMIRAGERSATTSTTRAVADALERLGDRHEKAACILRDALKVTEGDNA